MLLEKLEIRAVSTEKIAPNEKKEADLYGRIGYKLEEALADLVDNSIDAGAKHILIRFQKFDDRIHSVVIADDGHGMDEGAIVEAMRIGSDSHKASSQLGKYGTGLKSASLSQAQVVTVLSRHNGTAVGRRWTVENIRKGWLCEKLVASECSKALDIDLGPVLNRKSGTMVIWEQLEHLRASKDTLDRALEKARKVVGNELGIKFHRFLESGKVKIWIDEAHITDDAGGQPVQVLPLNPFDYGGSVAKAYPKQLKLPFQKHNTGLVLDLHIWPPKSSLPGYKLGGGKVASRQGFYFYRNDRLIQAGGWNGLQGDNSEPHLSLARVAVNLPKKLEFHFKLNIGKSSIDPAVEFSLGLETGEAGAIFKKFLIDAETTYRNQKKKDSAKFGFTGGRGFPSSVRRKMKAAFSEKGLPQPTEVAVCWNKLPADELVRVEPGLAKITLNKTFQKLLEVESPGAALMVKALFLLQFQDELGKAFLTETTREKIRRINQALLATIPA